MEASDTPRTGLFAETLTEYVTTPDRSGRGRALGLEQPREEPGWLFLHCSRLAFIWDTDRGIRLNALIKLLDIGRTHSVVSSHRWMPDRVRGLFADGRRFAHSPILARDGDWLFHFFSRCTYIDCSSSYASISHCLLKCSFTNGRESCNCFLRFRIHFFLINFFLSYVDSCRCNIQYCKSSIKIIISVWNKFRFSQNTTRVISANKNRDTKFP